VGSLARGLSVCVASTAVAGCFFLGGGGGSHPDEDAAVSADASPRIDAPPPVVYSIRELREQAPPIGDFVSIGEVVVTAVWEDADTCADPPCGTHVFVADPVEVPTGTETNLGMMLVDPVILGLDPMASGPVTAVGAGHLVEGDVVTIRGRVGELTLPRAASAMMVIDDGLVSPADRRAQTAVPTISRLAFASDADVAPIEAMVVRMEDVPIAWVGGDRRILGGGRVSSEMTTALVLSPGNCYASVAGIALYGARPTIMPRRASDLDTSPGIDCPDPPQREFDHAECTDSIDNDWDDLVDADDFDCVQSTWAFDDGAATWSVVEIKTGGGPAPFPGGYRKLAGVIVTAVDTHGFGAGRIFWVSDPVATAVANGGIRVDLDQLADDVTGLSVGDEVTVVAGVRDDTYSYDGDTGTERTMWQAFVVATGTGAVPAPAAVTSTVLDSQAALWEGQLVRVTDHRIPSGFTPAGHALLSDGVTTVLTGRDLVDFSVLPGSCLASITGIAAGRCGSRPADNSCMQLWPRTVGDVVEGGVGCP